MHFPPPAFTKQVGVCLQTFAYVQSFLEKQNTRKGESVNARQWYTFFFLVLVLKLNISVLRCSILGFRKGHVGVLRSRNGGFRVPRPNSSRSRPLTGPDTPRALPIVCSREEEEGADFKTSLPTKRVRVRMSKRPHSLHCGACRIRSAAPLRRKETCMQARM